MSWSLLLLCAAATGVIAFSSSALLAVGAGLFRRRLADLAGAAQARILLGIAVLPMLACIALMTAALAPSFSSIVDHCTEAASLHSHPHICIGHHVDSLPAVTLLIVAGLLLVRVVVTSLSLIARVIQSHAIRQTLTGASEEGSEGMRVLSIDEPQAFIIGAIHPTMFVTRGLLSGQYSEHLAPVLSHERAHVRRRDPLRRFIASLGLAFHLPGFATWLERRLATANEMAADAEAATEIQSPERVARALVQLTRAHKQVSHLAMAFGASDVELRVTTLLDSRPRLDRPGPYALVIPIVFFFMAVALSTEPIHHGIEIVLGLLSI